MHVLAYYALFFAFGALLYGRPDRDGEPMIERLGQRWWIILPITVLIVFPLGLNWTFVEEDAWLPASVAQITFAWALSIGLIGLFRAVLSTERRGVRYLSDSSYWLYVAHVPLVILVQALVNDWELPSFVKLSGITVGVTAVLLLTYQLFIRYTPIGTMLNGKRTRPVAD